ncbi:hypothetical protein HAP41_0000049530 (plasmid) [Bradyrhizobium barranii subsp. apii]|uniref:Uncharacterized protein n=1 Tax=Bradyrhizobium barranii subsp. apii TaxID=2819348 RepID=A0A8T5VSK4_9BRAD|nr:hypothetical protein [Bradyrhizobium barranii]UPT92351.1 hypothetical protein HAP41_0000049530 [Bradyrhizobium barranii subsp. apii]
MTQHDFAQVARRFAVAILARGEVQAATGDHHTVHDETAAVPAADPQRILLAGFDVAEPKDRTCSRRRDQPDRLPRLQFDIELVVDARPLTTRQIHERLEGTSEDYNFDAAHRMLVKRLQGSRVIYRWRPKTWWILGSNRGC